MMRIDEACSFLEWNTEARPRVAVVLGSGLGAFAGELTGAMAIPYSSIPDWPQEATPGHAGQLVFGNLGTMPVVVMSGRAHLYEGYTPEQVVFGVRVLGKLGVRAIVFSNSAGAVNPEIAPGS
ncbi:MAG: purine-nucleoside phosphorylase, partial [Bryobacteraceae bacterium]